MPAPERRHDSVLSSSQTLIMAVACAIALAALYYNQPILPLIAKTFGTDDYKTSQVVMFSQFGYAAGLFLFVPIGDRMDRKWLIVALLSANTVALVACAIAPSFSLLCLATFIAGLTTVTPQIIIPTVAALAAAKDRGRVVGVLLSGMSAGLLLGRTLSGFVADIGGWRAVYGLAIVLNVPLVAIVWHMLPKTAPTTDMSYPRLLKSMWHLFLQQPVLRAACATGFLTFGAFSALWATLALLLAQPPYTFNVNTIGLFGLIGIVSILTTPLIGRAADLLGSRVLIAVGAMMMIAAFGLISQSVRSVWILIAGIILVDLGYRAIVVSNQIRIYPLNPASPSRLNTLFMTSVFLGGAAGSMIGGLASHWSWIGIAVAGAGLGLSGLIVHLLTLRDFKATS